MTRTDSNSRGMGKTKGYLFLLLLVIVPFFIGWLAISMKFGATHPPATEMDGTQVAAFSLGRLIWGIVLLILGGAIYGIVWATNVFTLDFSKPVWPGLNRLKLRLVRIFAILPPLIGIAEIISAFLMPPLVALGLSTTMSSLVPFFIVIILGQYVLVLVDIWAPILKRIVRERMAELGVSAEDIDTGHYVGISEPAASVALKSGAYTEDDIGMLWIRPDCLIYKGDGRNFQISRGQLGEVERRANKNDTSAFAGCRNIVLNWTDDAGARQRIQLHPGDSVTLFATAREMDDLEQEIQQWKAEGPAYEPRTVEPPPLPTVT